MGSYVLKIKYGDVMRRVTVQKSYDEPIGPKMTFAELEGMIRKDFKIPAESDFVITYSDADNDVVTMVGDQDLHDALVLQRLHPLRLTVVVSEQQRRRQADSPPRPSQAQPQPEFLDLKNLFGNSLKMSQDTAKQTAQQLLQACEPLVKGGPSMVVTEFRDAIMKLASSTQMGAATSSQQQSQPATAGYDVQGVPSSVPFSELYPGFPPQLLSERPCFVWNAPRTETPAPAPVVSNGERIVQGTPAATPVQHRGVQCDVCNQLPIFGTRYKSNKKHDYDLCQKCFDTNGKIEDYTKIEKPLWRPRHCHGFDGPTIRCPAMPAFYGGRPSFGMRGPHMHGHQGHHGHPGHHGHQGHHGRHGFFGGGAHGPYGAKGDSRCGSASGGKLDARFVQDVTIFDGTEFAPGAGFTKIWRLRNSGSSAWPKWTQLMRVGGDALGTCIAVPLALSEEGLSPDGEVEVSVDLVAPEKPGRYVSHWRLVSPTGQKFGHRVWVLIQVVPSDEQSPQVLDSLMSSSSQEDELMEYNTAEPQPMEDEVSVDPFPAAADLNILADSREVQIVPEAVQYPEINMDALTLDAVVVDPAKTTQEENSPVVNTVMENTAVENSELGNFSMVNMPTVTEIPVEQVEANTAVAPRVAFAVDDEEPAEAEKYSETKKVAEEDSLEMTLGALESMGFKQRDLNEELLKNNNYDVQRTVDDLVMAAEWDPMLEELEEMGFYDTDMNRRLMFKNNGSVKRVVKELVQMYKDPKGKEQI